MDYTTIVSFISSVGFPITACVALAFYVKSLNEQHKEEVEKLSETINNNTLVLQKLCDKLGA